MLARLPIRLRLALAFAGVMAILLTGAGLFLRFSLASNLDTSIDRALRARAADVSALVAQADEGLSQAGQSPLTEAGESFAQVVDEGGRVVDATPLLRDRPLLDADERARAANGTVLLDRSSIPGLDEEVRLLATPARSDQGALIVVVGTSLEDREDAVRNLTALLLVGGPVALLLTSVAGYGVASAALRPVEAMRRRAELISGGGEGERLPVGPARDEIGRLGETLNEMLARIDRALARERGFVADASHELRTPLAILKTELELALRGDHSTRALREAITSAGEETDRLTRLAEDLLVIARSDQGRLPVRAEPLEARVVLRAVAERFGARAAREGRTVRVDDGPSIALLADGPRLEQALGNLIENALSHGAGPITLSARRSDAAVELRVRDEGRGLSTEFAPTAFERFTRADPARARGGAGLGLSIVRAIARAHRGEAHVANGAGGGFEAWLSLPMALSLERVSPSGL
jgi:two-component system, OmpR family, sensor kinase